MQKDPLISFLAGALSLAAIVVFVLVVSCQWRFRQLRTLEPQVASIQMTQNMLLSLASDTVEYSKHNPAVQPILDRIGAKVVKPANAK